MGAPHQRSSRPTNPLFAGYDRGVPQQFFYDEFWGDIVDNHWFPSIVGSGPSSGILTAGNSGGVVGLSISSANSLQDAILDFGGNLHFPLGSTFFECRLRLTTVPPSSSYVIAGFASAHIASPNSIIYNAWFYWNSGRLRVETDDNSSGGDNDDNIVGANISGQAEWAAAGDWNIYQIDTRELTDVKFIFNGRRLLPTTTLDMSNAEGQTMQPYFTCAKNSGTGNPAMEIDYVKVWVDK